MRALVPNLPSPHPLGPHLPALYQSEDAFALGLASAFDRVLAPIFASLDNFDAYLDPSLAPADFVDWLGTWVGLSPDEVWSPARRREFAAGAVALYRVRGTRRGLKAYLELLTGGEVEVEDSGGTASATASGAPFPGRPDFELAVTVRSPDGAADADRLEALVAACKPAHVRHRVTVAGPPPGTRPAQESDA
jgi:phage tail-like protein